MLGSVSDLLSLGEILTSLIVFLLEVANEHNC